MRCKHLKMSTTTAHKGTFKDVEIRECLSCGAVLEIEHVKRLTDDKDYRGLSKKV